jgi:DNA-3-methyladenine glycosylase I
VGIGQAGGILAFFQFFHPLLFPPCLLVIMFWMKKETAAVQRCGWAQGDPLMSAYHDREWGVPVHQDRRHFEFLILEAAQAGLSWLIVLRKRKGYQNAFARFDYNEVARFGEKDVRRLMKDPGIIRNELKIRAAVENAKRFIEVRKEFGTFNRYLWNFVDGKPVVNQVKSYRDILPTTQLSDAVSRDLKKRGFRFVGSTVIYAHLQAVGVVNDHEMSCFRRAATS